MPAKLIDLCKVDGCEFSLLLRRLLLPSSGREAVLHESHGYVKVWDIAWTEPVEACESCSFDVGHIELSQDSRCDALLVESFDDPAVHRCPRRKVVKVIHLEGLSEKEDVSDWLRRGGTVEGLKSSFVDLDPWEPVAEWEPNPEPIPPPSFVDAARTGLMARQLRDAVQDQLILARGPSRSLWRFIDGVWKDDGDDAVRAVTARIMDDDYRPSYAANVLDMFKADPPRLLTAEAIPEFINVRNGMLDWETGRLYPHSPDYMTVNQLPHDWDESATAERSEQFLHEVLEPDSIEYVTELIGYCAFDGNPHQKAALLVGHGENGKGELLGMVESMLGKESVSAIPLHTLAENRFATANLYGKLANLAGDLPSTRIEDSAQFKQITGGDLITAERKYQHAFQFTARAFPMFSANEIPGSDDESHGYMRRWEVIRFPNSFAGTDREPGLTARLASESSGLLVVAIGGLRNLMNRNEFDRPKSAQNEFDQFRRHIDPVRSFAELGWQVGEVRTPSSRNWEGMRLTQQRGRMSGVLESVGMPLVAHPVTSVMSVQPSPHSYVAGEEVARSDKRDTTCLKCQRVLGATGECVNSGCEGQGIPQIVLERWEREKGEQREFGE